VKSSGLSLLNRCFGGGGMGVALSGDHFSMWNSLGPPLSIGFILVFSCLNLNRIEKWYELYYQIYYMSYCKEN